LAAAGLQVEDVVVLIDRASGGEAVLAARGYRLHSVFTLPALLDYWEATDQVAPAQLQVVRDFLQKPLV